MYTSLQSAWSENSKEPQAMQDIEEFLKAERKILWTLLHPYNNTLRI